MLEVIMPKRSKTSPVSETTAEKPRGRGRESLPAGKRRSYWIGAHTTEVGKREMQAKAARERPGKTFADWLLECAGRPLPMD
jgi:hypothetical protein